MDLVPGQSRKMGFKILILGRSKTLENGRNGHPVIYNNSLFLINSKIQFFLIFLVNKALEKLNTSFSTLCAIIYNCCQYP